MTGAAKKFGSSHGSAGSDRGLLPLPRTVKRGTRREQIECWSDFYGDLFGLTTTQASIVTLWERSVSGDERGVLDNNDGRELLFIDNQIPIDCIVRKYEQCIDSVWTCDLKAMMVPARPESQWYFGHIDPAQHKTSSEGITLRERLIIGLKYYFETGGIHLDRETTTVCTGSPFSCGRFPHVGTYGNMVCVDTCDILHDANHAYYRVSVI